MTNSTPSEGVGELSAKLREEIVALINEHVRWCPRDYGLSGDLEGVGDAADAILAKLPDADLLDALARVLGEVKGDLILIAHTWLGDGRGDQMVDPLYSYARDIARNRLSSMCSDTPRQDGGEEATCDGSGV